MDKTQLTTVFEQLRRDLNLFISLSLQESEETWEQWCSSIESEIKVNCFSIKGCTKKDCPVYGNSKCRCWLIAGTMCGGEVQGAFAKKYKSCMECSVYRDIVYKDSTSEVFEHLITVMHNMRTKQVELKALTTRDTLTGLYNRNYFNIIIEREIERINRHGGHLAVIMLDVDNFKHINDTYGHLHGDGVLRECASILNRVLRSSDYLVRLGGDEFIIIMPQADCIEKEPLIGRIMKTISGWNSEYASADYKLSLSIGCATFERGNDIETVMQEADDDMYENKKYKKTTRG
jgi:diguanylate cyclase (GGDEF)-like protein